MDRCTECGSDVQVSQGLCHACWLEFASGYEEWRAQTGAGDEPALETEDTTPAA